MGAKALKLTNPLHTPGPLLHQIKEPYALRSRTDRPARCRYLSKGFTLLELLVVIILIGVALALALPRFTGTGRAYLRTDASRVSSFLRFISNASATRKLYYKVSFDIAAGEIRTERSRDGAQYLPESDPNVRRLKLRDEVSMEDMVVEGLGKVNSGVAEVTFTPTGGAPPFRLHLAADKDMVTVEFNPYSEDVSVKDGYDPT